MSEKFKREFYKLWLEALKAGLSSSEARDYANLTLKGCYFHAQSDN